MLRLCRSLLFAGLFLVTAWISTSVVWAQATGTILGTVTDSTTAIVVGAKVTVTNVNTNVSREVVTNGAGYYQVDNLIPGQYTVGSEMPGFKKAVRSQFELQV